MIIPIQNSRKSGIFFVLTGAICWGIGGTVSQKLFQQYGIEVNWFVTVRLLIAGILLLGVQSFTPRRTQIFDIWKSSKSALQLIIFGLFGMLAVQYTYMASIQHGNSAVATLLQYLSPVMIMVYMIWRRQAALTRKDVTSAILALSGCFFLLTNGSLSQLSVALPAVLWGLLSGVAAAFYTLYAVKLIEKVDSLVVVGWAMIIGGAALSLIHPPWKMDFASLRMETYGYLIFTIIFGTMIAFWFYIESLKSLTAKETSLLGSAEPLAAVGATVVWLHEPFGYFQWLGTVCIIGLILLLQSNRSRSVKANDK
ncbi:EamA family transporter [Paenibacillus sp. JNUCC31]|uniref:DMT family transporter n=1 Tax=Paenibacillus sp. JNUCC-31 TaxID=2777983 RepID=UPI001782FB92|nr:EamA family transporter [Paenibacillus sp. JNUCC-31]QOS79955.1 EamA family transporter [Paenibacillus sp. JNUCC-31]